MTAALRELLADSVRLFAGLDDIALDNLLAQSQQITVKARKVVCRKGDPGDALFIVVRGKLNEPGNNEVAQVPQPGRENCAGKNFFEKAACELKNAGVENAVGTIINKSR